jgi:glycosyltransferase involved in cell wall biosynthesis
LLNEKERVGNETIKNQKSKMRIALVSTIAAPVRKDSFGSVEAWTWLMARELTRLGHKITVFGCGGSEVNGEFVETLAGPYGAPGSYDNWQLCEWINLCRAIQQSARFDVLHSQAYLWGVPLQSLSRAPMVHTIHIVPDHSAARLWQSAPHTVVTAISKSQWSEFPDLTPAAVIPHAVDPEQFTFREQPDDYVLYLGRFTPSKGPLQAIDAARSLGLRLVLAGPENPYFREHIRPLIDGKSVTYAGYVSGAERNKLLGGARALLYPIQYPEAFGFVLLEAMLCGTPVAAMRLGAVSEIVEDGITGFTANADDGFAAAVSKCLALRRQIVHQRSLASADPGRMAAAYAAVYSQACHR